MEPHFLAVVMQAMFQNNVAGRRRQIPLELGLEGDEMRPA
jgi:hypothetical protein